MIGDAVVSTQGTLEELEQEHLISGVLCSIILSYTQKPLMDFPKNFPDVNRIEVISSEGEEFFWDVYDECSNVRVNILNDGKTLKVFLVKGNQK